MKKVLVRDIKKLLRQNNLDSLAVKKFGEIVTVTDWLYWYKKSDDSDLKKATDVVNESTDYRAINVGIGATIGVGLKK